MKKIFFTLILVVSSVIVFSQNIKSPSVESLEKTIDSLENIILTLPAEAFKSHDNIDDMIKILKEKKDIY